MNIRSTLLAALTALFPIGGLWSAQPGSAQSATRCFPETGHCISGPIRAYWERNGGLPGFGYPISDQQIETVEDRTIPAQWFERDRLEIQRDGTVTAGRLGARLLELRGIDWQDTPRAQNPLGPDCIVFPVTNRQVCQPFLSYWQRNGGLERFGYPITEPALERVEGRDYTVQYFERRRMEHHPENVGTPFDTLLGLLGREVYGRTLPDLSSDAPRIDARRIPGVPLGINLEAVTMVGDVGYAVGNDGVAGYVYRIERGAGGYQIREERRYNSRLTSIAAVNSVAAWATSEDGRIFRRDADGWGEGLAVVANARLNTIQVFGADGAGGWAAGTVRLTSPEGGLRLETLLLRLTPEGRWIVDESVRTPGEVTGLSFSAAQGFLVGNNGTAAFIYRFGAGSWVREELPNPCAIGSRIYRSSGGTSRATGQLSIAGEISAVAWGGDGNALAVGVDGLVVTFGYR